MILIPAYQPSGVLPALVKDLRTADPAIRILIIDDGSGPRFARIFDAAREAGAMVVGYPRNRGKGQALKTGFGYLQRHYPGDAVVCADGDGQHSVEDILVVAARVESLTRDTSSGTTMVLGERCFTGTMPLRSRAGNSTTRTLFRFATGRRLRDTQTGLRGYPAAMLPWLQTVRGDRYEYELNLLLRASAAGHRIDTVDVATIYLSGNDSSHFRPISDSVRVYAPFLRFALSSLAAYGIDLAVFLLLSLLTQSLLATVVGARVVSATINFVINRTLVFGKARRRNWRPAALRYCALAVVLLAVNYALMFLLTDVGLAGLPAKILTEAILFAGSYAAQKRFLGRSPRKSEEPSTPPALTPTATHK